MTFSVKEVDHGDGTTTRQLQFDVINQSMVKMARLCPNQFRMKYVEGLLPKVDSKPLTRGKWFHALLEARYKGENWKKVHKQWCLRFSDLFDEEKEKLGDLPREMRDLMLSYIWHYKLEEEDGGWEIIEVEYTIEVKLPDGRIFKGRVDMIVRDKYGLWLVDHKTHKVLPSLLQRQLDLQSPLYIWACRENGIPVDGFIWNYVKTKAPSVPTVLKNGTRFSKKLGETDYYTYAVALKKSGLPVEDYRHTLEQLKSHRYEHDKIQTSPFFQRHILERKDRSIDQAVRELLVTKDRIEAYDWDPDYTERHNGRHCDWMCSYQALCVAELHGDNTRPILRNYRKGDPFEYYEETKDKDDE